MSVELACYVKKLLFMLKTYKFYDFFCRRHSLNNLFQLTLNDNFQNLYAGLKPESFG